MVADSLGNASGTFTVPANFATGAHTVSLTGTSIAGAVQVLSAPVSIAAAIAAATTTVAPTTLAPTTAAPTVTIGSSGALPVTGSESTTIAGYGLLLLGTGGALLIVARRRRRT